MEMSTTKTLLAGPWIGEFGWELFQWQGYLRQQARNYDRVIVGTYTGHAGMYRDFATNIRYNTEDFLQHGYDPDGIGISDRQAVQRGRPPFNYQQYINRFWEGFSGDIVYPQYTNIPPTEQAWADWVTSDTYNPRLIALVKRSRRYSLKKNWSDHHWTKLSEELEKRQFQVKYAPADWDASLLLFSQCSLAVGGSTGGLHLASLCQCPHLVWSRHNQICADGFRLDHRYNVAWNPHQTPCITADLGWQPSIPAVLDAVLNAHHRIGRQ